MNERTSLFHPHEIMLVVAGVLMLASVGIIAADGSFAVWIAAKILYGIGVAATLIVS